MKVIRPLPSPASVQVLARRPDESVEMVRKFTLRNSYQSNPKAFNSICRSAQIAGPTLSSAKSDATKLTPPVQLSCGELCIVL